MIAAALSARFHVYKTPGNSNSQVGVPITVSEITKEDEVGVLELGMSEPGELTVIARIAKPDVAVITNIGITHIEQLGSRENIYREKMTIQDGLSDGGILILNGDDDMLCRTRGKAGVKTVYYGTGETCDYRAVDIVLMDGKTEFTAVPCGKTQKVLLNVMGMHNVMNALAAIAVCCERGMTMEEAAEGLLTFHGFKHRQQVYADGRFTVMDDSYNASPASMKAALDVFQGLTGKRHIAVLADMKELGGKLSGLPQGGGRVRGQFRRGSCCDARRGMQESGRRRPCGKGDPGGGIFRLRGDGEISGDGVSGRRLRSL